MTRIALAMFAVTTEMMPWAVAIRSRPSSSASRPIACFGNSDGDLAMLQYTTINNPRPSFGLIVHHTDAEREYAYDAVTRSSGKLVEALKEAPQRGWIVVDMERDWKTVYSGH